MYNVYHLKLFYMFNSCRIYLIFFLSYQPHFVTIGHSCSSRFDAYWEIHGHLPASSFDIGSLKRRVGRSLTELPGDSLDGRVGDAVEHEHSAHHHWSEVLPAKVPELVWPVPGHLLHALAEPLRPEHPAYGHRLRGNFSHFQSRLSTMSKFSLTRYNSLGGQIQLVFKSKNWSLVKF